MTLNGHCALCCKIHALPKPTTKTWMKVDLYWQRRWCSPMTVSSNIRFMRIFAGVLQIFVKISVRPAYIWWVYMLFWLFLRYTENSYITTRAIPDQILLLLHSRLRGRGGLLQRPVVTAETGKFCIARFSRRKASLPSSPTFFRIFYCFIHFLSFEVKLFYSFYVRVVPMRVRIAYLPIFAFSMGTSAHGSALSRSFILHIYSNNDYLSDVDIL